MSAKRQLSSGTLKGVARNGSVMPYFAALVLLGIALYAHTLRYPFVYDDDAFIVENKSIQTLKNFPKFFTDANTLASDKELAHG